MNIIRHTIPSIYNTALCLLDKISDRIITSGPVDSKLQLYQSLLREQDINRVKVLRNIKQVKSNLCQKS